ncbi:MAG TPA: MerR family transcriptional regulator [Kiloniellaceae bacterium]|nr:MerR family transcriptional regulator [Kiloniellaceae bacterium]
MNEIQKFTVRQAARLAGFDNHMMVDYLCRQKIVTPSVRSAPGRGRPRLYSFWDLVVLRAINRILTAGVPVARLKQSISDLQKDLKGLTPEEAIVRRFVVTDGTKLFAVHNADEIVEVTNDRQLAFAFVLDAEHARQEVLEESQRLLGGAP